MNYYSHKLESLKASGNFRTIPSTATEAADTVVDFSSNDYLGLASDPTLQEEFFDSPHNRRIPLTASASRLLAAGQREFHDLEQMLSGLYGRDALLFNSGYHANTGLVSALASAPSTLIVTDRLVHASIIDGIILSKAPFTRYRHNDYDHLERIISDKASGYDRMLIITEGVFSMDGDRCDVARLADIKRRHPGTMLYIDEAHSMGVLGPHGLGLCMASDKRDYDAVDIIVGTFGKALASSGAFAVMNETMRHWAVNHARSLIFSTALPPLQAAWTRFTLEKTLQADDRRAHLLNLAATLNPEARYIYPHIIGDAAAAVETSRRLLDMGMKVLPIRTPTVPPGTERLRISLSAAITPRQVELLRHTLATLRPSI